MLTRAKVMMTGVPGIEVVYKLPNIWPSYLIGGVAFRLWHGIRAVYMYKTMGL